MLTAAFAMLWLKAFVFTQAIEVPIYLGLAKTRLWKAFLLSAVTHPLLWFVYWYNVPLAHVPKTIFGELLVLAMETAMLFLLERGRLSVGKAAACALVANGASFGLGELSRALFGVP